MHTILQEFETSQWGILNPDGSMGEYHSESDVFEPIDYYMCEDCDFTSESVDTAIEHMEETKVREVV
jgi:hypothetical protein